jgi:hypothetical protein
MKVLEISSITVEDTVIYYRRNYTALAKIEFLSQQADVKIAFTIEIDPLGRKSITLSYPCGTNFDYPVMPVTQSIKDKVLSLDNEGSLPL